MNVDDMPDLTDAMARLDAAEQAEIQTPDSGQAQTDGAIPQATPPEPDTTDVVANPDSLPSDTPAAAEPKPAEPASKKPVTTDPKASSFTKDKQRRDDSWKALNTEKTTFKTERDQFEALKLSHQREVERFKTDQAKASNKFTPEQYEQAAQQRETAVGGLTEQAEAWDARAEKLEGNGDFKGAAMAKAKADEIREQALLNKAQIRQFKDMAAQMRANPDPTLEQIKQKREHEMREYTLAAVGKWPDFGVRDSEFQKKVTAELQEARKSGIEVNENPSLMYHAARLVAAETAAASVPAKDKELGELRAKVKKLEALTAPGGGAGSIQTQPSGNVPRTDAEEESDLRSIALNL